MGSNGARANRPDLHFQLYTAKVDHLLRDLREGEADLAVWASTTGPSQDTRHCWAEPLVWVRAPSTVVDAAAPVPLVSYGEDCLLGRAAMNTLSQAGRDYEKVFIGSNLIGLIGAVAAGLGVMALPRSRAGLPGITVWDNAPLPKLPDIFCGIYVRGGADAEEREQLADAIAAALSPQSASESFTNGERDSAA